MTNVDCVRYRIGFTAYTRVNESEIKTTRFGQTVLSLEILNPEFEVGTLNPKTFVEFCRVNGFLSNPDIFPPAIF